MVAGGGADRVQSVRGDERVLREFQAGVDGQLSRSGLRRDGGSVTGAGIGIDVDPQHYPNGHFGRLHDPEGNPIELWQPEERDAPS
jgi:hypothetical protein